MSYFLLSNFYYHPCGNPNLFCVALLGEVLNFLPNKLGTNRKKSLCNPYAMY
jgi:hypothetical protein